MKNLKSTAVSHVNISKPRYNVQGKQCMLTFQTRELHELNLFNAEAQQDLYEKRGETLPAKK